MLTVYSNGCPKCKILEKKLLQLNIEHFTITDMTEILKEADKVGILSMPFTIDDSGTARTFEETIKYISEV